jgi:hypothetical protein
VARSASHAAPSPWVVTSTTEASQVATSVAGPWGVQVARASIPRRRAVVGSPRSNARVARGEAMDEQQIASLFATLTAEHLTEDRLRSLDGLVDDIALSAVDEYHRRRGWIDPVGLLERPGTGDLGGRRRTVRPTRRESIGQFYRRLGTEAQQMGATAFATAMMCPSAIGAVDVDPADQRSIDAAKARGELTTNLVWYAESIPEDRIRCGLWLVGADAALLPMVETTAASAPALFRGVLPRPRGR